MLLRKVLTQHPRCGTGCLSRHHSLAAATALPGPAMHNKATHTQRVVNRAQHSTPSQRLPLNGTALRRSAPSTYCWHVLHQHLVQCYIKPSSRCACPHLLNGATNAVVQLLAGCLIIEVEAQVSSVDGLPKLEVQPCQVGHGDRRWHAQHCSSIVQQNIMLSDMPTASCYKSCIATPWCSKAQPPCGKDSAPLHMASKLKAALGVPQVGYDWDQRERSQPACVPGRRVRGKKLSRGLSSPSGSTRCSALRTSGPNRGCSSTSSTSIAMSNLCQAEQAGCGVMTRCSAVVA